jgi:hypothetical protein
MTKNFNKIIAEYRSADFNQRLNMYLQFPGLRSDFIIIDQNDLKTDISAGFKLRKKLPLNQMSMVLSLVANCARKIFGIASA